MPVMPFGNYEWIPGHLDGQDVYVIASGPSLIDFDFSRLDGKKKIVISHASRFVSPDYLVFLDRSVMETLSQDFYSQDYKTVVGKNVHLQPKCQLTRINYSNTPQMNPTHGFWGAKSTGYFALNLALSMRAKNIYLLGFDCCGHEHKVNFYDAKKVKGYCRGGGERYEGMIKGFEKFSQYSNIINLSPISKIPYFKKMEFGQAA